MNVLSMVGDPALAGALILFAVAALCYVVGGMNGAIVASHLFYGDDIRKYGSGNAGLTNFYRIYGVKHVWCVLLVDMGKAAAAILFSAWVFGPEGAVFGKYFGALFCIMGHMFPFFYRFRGGKGILCSGMALLLLDWRVALAGWGTFLLLSVLTKYVSLGSICAAVTLPLSTFFVYRGASNFSVIFSLSLAMAALVLWAHRENMDRLMHGKENRFRWHKEEPEQKKNKK